MQYIDADRLRAEIGRRKKKNMNVDIQRLMGRYFEDRDILALLDSLQQEQPSLPDLDEAAENWCKESNKGIALCADRQSHYLADGMDAFKAGAEWATKYHKEQKHAEWSEEDKEIMQYVLDFLEDPITADLCIQLRKECQDWLRKLIGSNPSDLLGSPAMSR